MKIAGKHYRSIWVDNDGWVVHIFDQTRLPHAVEVLTLTSCEDGAGDRDHANPRRALIGATAAYGMCLALREDPSDEALERAAARLKRTRPTAVNLAWAVEEIIAAVRNRPRAERVAAAYARAGEIADDDVATCRAIGAHGVRLIREVAVKHPARPVNVLTIAMPDGWRRSIGGRRWRPSIWRMTKGSRSMSGWTRRDRAIRGRRLPPSSSAPMACRTPSSPTMRAAI